MRASRLLRLLLVLQNRGRMTSAELSVELEVTPRTILRDVDALTEAGLPIIVHRGARGGIELGFNYRTRLLGLTPEEAEALSLLLRRPSPELLALGLAEAAGRAAEKLLASLPDTLKARAEVASRQFRFEGSPSARPDPTLAALATAVREARIVWVCRPGPSPRELHPAALVLGEDGWRVLDARPDMKPIPIGELGEIRISAHRYR